MFFSHFCFYKDNIMNSFGQLFRISLFGESHGKLIGIIIDGCPPGIAISTDDFKTDLLLRKTGAKGTSKRIEPDIPEICSGVYNNFTTGAPICIQFKNNNTISSDYLNIKDKPRPGHADFVAVKKYKGFANLTGGGHFSGRLTLPIVAAGVIAKKIISHININAQLIKAGGNKNIDEAINQAIDKKDSIGGIIECRVSNMLIGLGEPFFNSIESVISHLVFSIPGIKGIEFGTGFDAANMFGSEHNDLIINTKGKTATNNAGGINGGISNGNDLLFKVAVKPTSSIGLPQQTINIKTGNTEELLISGRHDSCIALRMPVIIEAVTAIALTDFYLQNA